jgi:DNA-binding MarR family transcriptional regulator
MPNNPNIPDAELGDKIKLGQETAEYLWHVPDDTDSREKIRVLLDEIKELSAKKGRTEMPRLCDDLLEALRSDPTQQQVDLLHDGFNRLQKLFGAAKTGLL